MLDGTELSFGDDASATALATLGSARNASNGGSRRLAFSTTACTDVTKCPTYVSYGTKSSYTACPAGTTCSGCGNAAMSYQSCTTCKPGYYVNANSGYTCSVASTYLTDSTAKTRCHSAQSCASIPLGYIGVTGIYSSGTGTSSLTLTPTADLATYPAAGVQSIRACGIGTYAGTYVGGTQTGAFSNTYGIGTATACLPCTATAGYYCPAASKTAAGVVCSTNYYCPGTTNDRVKCATGYYCSAAKAAAGNCIAAASCTLTGN